MTDQLRVAENSRFGIIVTLEQWKAQVTVGWYDAVSRAYTPARILPVYVPIRVISVDDDIL